MRTWTAVNGKEVEAEFVSNEEGVVKLKLESGKVFEVPLDKLSKNDQNFIETSSLTTSELPDNKNTKRLKLTDKQISKHLGFWIGKWVGHDKSTNQIFDQFECKWKEEGKSLTFNGIGFENGEKKDTYEGTSYFDKDLNTLVETLTFEKSGTVVKRHLVLDAEHGLLNGFPVEPQLPEGIDIKYEWAKVDQNNVDFTMTVTKGEEILDHKEVLIKRQVDNQFSAKTSVEENRIKFAIITNATANFWAYGRAGAQKAASEYDDIEIVFKMGDGTASKQREICDSLLDRGFKGIAISPPNPKGQQEMLNNWAKKASIITIDTDAPESDRLFYLGTNNVEAGRQAGELLKEALPNGGKVMAFVGVEESFTTKERYQGIKEAVEGTKIEIIGLRVDGANISRARSLAEETLTEHPDLAGMVGLWAYNAPACLKAVRDKGFIGKVKIIAFDEEVETLKAIDNGEIHGTVTQQPYELCYQAIKALRSIVVEGKSPKELEVTKSGQKFIPTKIIRKGEAADYLIKLQKWNNS